MNNALITFGEIMTRYSPSDYLRLEQVMPGSIDVTFAGAEANVAVSYSRLGGESHFVTVLPDNMMGDACIMNLRTHEVGTNHILRVNDGRMGAYYVESGTNQRPGKVEYDRDYSSLSITEPKKYDWDNIFQDKTWFHITGITPAISKNACNVTRLAVKAAKEANLTVSCDLNFRGKLWRWDKNLSPKELAKKEMHEILKFVDVVIGNKYQANDVLAINLENSGPNRELNQIAESLEISKMISEKYSSLRYVAMTLRESLSANHNRWGALLYDCEKDGSYYSPQQNGEYLPYEITDIVDRLGAGDSFAASLIFSLHESKLSLKHALNFSVAASCIAHTIKGDFNIVTAEEVKKLAEGDSLGRVVR